MAYSKAKISNKQRRKEIKDVRVARNKHQPCRHDRDPNVSAHIGIAAGISFAFGFVLRRHDRDPNVSTHIRIASGSEINPLKVCVCLCLCLCEFVEWFRSSARPRSECECSHSGRGWDSLTGLEVESPK